MIGRKVCFFAKVIDPEYLRRVEFYAQDIRILEELGFDVHIATKLSELRPADFYFIWWWSWAFAPVLFANLLGRPSLITGTLDSGYFRRRPALHRILYRLALRRASANVFVSELEAQGVPLMHRVNNPRYSPHIVDTSVYCPGHEAREDFVFTVAWMQGENAQRKCMPELLKAIPIVCRSHPDVRFVIAGERGTYYPKLAALAQESGVADRVEFPGVISRERKIELMQRCKVYLQPSRFEGFGLAILEALSCGAAVVTSPVGAVPEVVGDAAKLVDGSSPQSIADAVTYLLDHEGERRELGRRARARAEARFPFARRYNDLRSIINEIRQRV